MQRYLPLLLVIVVAALLLTGQLERGAMPQAEAATSGVQLSENSTNGHITVETDTIKGVWHTRTLASESNNQGGGALYALYHKPTDPQMLENLIAYPSFTGWGDGRSTALWTGIGGVGTTTLYAAETLPAQSYYFADVIGENNSGGTLESYSATIDEGGNAVLNFTYRVRNQSSGRDWYRIHKRWTVEPAGTILLKVDWEILYSGYFAEPALRTNWSRDLGWDRFVKYGRDWLNPTQVKYYLGSGSIEDANCWDGLNRFVPDWFAYTGSETAPTLMMRPDYPGGFAESGSYQLGASKWGSPANPVQEQCSLPNYYVGAHVINWMAAWGGSPPHRGRYRALEAGTAWSDLYRIDLADSLPAGSLEIARVSVNSLGENRAQLTWETNADSDATVEVSTDPSYAGSWMAVGTDGNLAKNHRVTVNNLIPGTNYVFRVKSRDSSGRLAVSSGYTYLESGPAFVLSISETEAYWNNYSDFQNHKLSVHFDVSNRGPYHGHNIKIDSIRNSNGVRNGSAVPIVLGQVNAGTTASFSTSYVIPSGVQSFKTQLFGSGFGPNGEVVNFP